MHKGERRVVRHTSRMLIPSTPTAYWMLNVGIHCTRSTNCMPRSPESKPDQRTKEECEDSAAHMQVRFAEPSGRCGRRTGAAIPRKGTAIRQLIRWSVSREFMSITLKNAFLQHENVQKRYGHHQPGDQNKQVVLKRPRFHIL